EHGDDPAWDGIEANALYDLLEREVIPEFYSRNEAGIPTAWTGRMRESMARLTPRYSASRAVQDYTEQHYLPAALALRSRIADNGAVGKRIVDWRHEVEKHWDALSFGAVKVETHGDYHEFEVRVRLNNLNPDAVRVELCADSVSGAGGAYRQTMSPIGPRAGAQEDSVYRANAPAARPAADYTARATPYFGGVSVPLEASQILWQR
ncbi:MAG: DUF3417 domain-containing protein, partial [Pseudomonadota bacterium]|nr:DUF3417 domain-containing protein [Pseudomonadota bacterium]